MSCLTKPLEIKEFLIKEKSMSNEKPPDVRGNFERPMITCPKCGGSGKTSFEGQKREAQCGTCKGKGQITG